MLILNKISKMAILFLPNRRLQRNRFLRYLGDFENALHRQFHFCRHLLRRRLSSEFLNKTSSGAVYPVNGLHHVNRNPDGSGLVGNRPGYGLPNPPGRIGAELIAFSIIKLVHGFNQTQIALLNQIQKLHSSSGIALCNADCQTEIGL